MPTRRELLQLVGAGALAAATRATGATTGCGDNAPAVAATAVLDPDEDSVVVAVWTPLAAREAAITVRAGNAPARELRIALAGGLGAAEITGLAADTAHEVAIAIGSGEVAVHAVRTAPRADDPRPVRLAVFADYDPNPAFASGVIDAIVAAAPELMIALGDFPYTDNGPPAVTVAAYRQRHAELRSHPPVRPLLEACGLFAIYDDHEVINDWDAASAASEPERHAAALAVWDEFFPRRPRIAPGEVRYRSWRWGAHLECFLLDCRRFRSANAAPDGADKTMLGAVQRAWLIAGITGSTATFKLVLTSVPLDFGNGHDHWASFASERDALFAAIAGVPGVAFMTADQHWFAAHRHGHGIREFQVGPLARGLGQPSGDPAGVVYRAARFNAGLVEIDGDRLTITGVGDRGERFYTETVTADELTPRASPHSGIHHI